MAFGWYYPKVENNTSMIYDPFNSLDDIWIAFDQSKSSKMLVWLISIRR
jgi:hypothetical protein